MEDLQQAQRRLNNIKSVMPILNALRTISLGSWQSAQKQRRAALSYQQQLYSTIPWLLPHLSRWRTTLEIKAPIKQISILAIGSERGLCGRFNISLARRALQAQAEQTTVGRTVELAALGSRLCRHLQHRGQSLSWSGSLPSSAAALTKLAFQLIEQWLERYERSDLDQVYLVYNAYRGVGRTIPTLIRLIPPHISFDRPESLNPSWPPIVETDPVQLYIRIVRQWMAFNLYTLLLESATAEHSTRYQLMEAATQNADRLEEELTVSVQTARQQAITQEVQNLIAGAGMLSRPT